MNLLESKTVLPDSNGVQSLTPALPPHLPSNGADSCPTEVKRFVASAGHVGVTVTVSQFVPDDGKFYPWIDSGSVTFPALPGTAR